MATTDPLSTKVAQSVATQLSQFLPPPQAAGLEFAAAPLKQPALAESLAVCILSVKQVEAPPDDLTTLVAPSGVWCHVVHSGNQATHLAMSRSHAFGSEELEVQELAESQVAGKLEAALTMLDAEIPDDTVTVRLIIAPAYFVYALAVVRPKKITAYLVDQPEGQTTLKPETEYPFRDFLKRLAKGTPGMSLAAP